MKNFPLKLIILLLISSNIIAQDMFVTHQDSPKELLDKITSETFRKAHFKEFKKKMKEFANLDSTQLLSIEEELTTHIDARPSIGGSIFEQLVTSFMIKTLIKLKTPKAIKSLTKKLEFYKPTRTKSEYIGVQIFYNYPAVAGFKHIDTSAINIIIDEVAQKQQTDRFLENALYAIRLVVKRHLDKNKNSKWSFTHMKKHSKKSRGSKQRFKRDETWTLVYQIIKKRSMNYKGEAHQRIMDWTTFNPSDPNKLIKLLDSFPSPPRTVEEKVEIVTALYKLKLLFFNGLVTDTTLLGQMALKHLAIRNRPGRRGAQAYYQHYPSFSLLLAVGKPVLPFVITKLTQTEDNERNKTVISLLTGFLRHIGSYPSSPEYANILFRKDLLKYAEKYTGKERERLVSLANSLIKKRKPAKWLPPPSPPPPPSNNQK